MLIKHIFFFSIKIFW